MKEHLTDESILKLKAAICLLGNAQSLLEDVKNEVLDESNYSADTDEFEKVIDELGENIFKIEEEYFPKKELKEYLSAEMVEMLSRDLPNMIEIDEVKQTFDLIQQVMTNKIKDKKYLEDILDYIDKTKDSKELDEFVFSKKFKELYLD